MHRVGLRLDLRHVLEHVLRGELELFERLAVVQVGAQEVVVVAAVGLREADHEVDHADVGRHGHAGDGTPRRRIVIADRDASTVSPRRDGSDHGSGSFASMADWGHATDLDDVRGQVAIAGIGETAYTKASGRTAREIGTEAAERAIADAGLEPADIDGLTWSGAFADFDVAAFHEHFGTTHDMWTSPWGGGMAWAATAPYLAAQAIRDGKAHARAQRVPGRVGDAARLDDRRPGRGARRAVAEAEPRSAVRLVPAAGLLRHDHAPAHARVRHDRGAVRRGRGRVPPPRQPASRRGDARQDR